MKKIFLLIGLFIMTTVTYAQLSIGAKGGINYFNVSTPSGFLDNSPRVGFHVGLFTIINLPEKFGLQPEVYFSRQSYSAGEIEALDSADNSIVIFENIVNLDYINVPILINYKILPTLRLQLGPQFGFGLSGNNRLRNIVGDASQFERDFSNTIDLSTAEIGVAAGIQFSLAKLIVQARYVYGLTDNTSNTSRIRNRNFQLSLGYKFF